MPLPFDDDEMLCLASGTGGGRGNGMDKPLPLLLPFVAVSFGNVGVCGALKPLHITMHTYSEDLIR